MQMFPTSRPLFVVLFLLTTAAKKAHTDEQQQQDRLFTTFPDDEAFSNEEKAAWERFLDGSVVTTGNRQELDSQADGAQHYNHFQFVYSLSIPLVPSPLPPPPAKCMVDANLTCKTSDGQSCHSLQARTTNCYIDRYFEIEISNTGPVNMDLTKVSYSLNGQVLDYRPSFPSTFAPGQMHRVTQTLQVNLCIVSSYDALVVVHGKTPNGNVCQAQENITVQVTPLLPLTPPPTSATRLTPRPSTNGLRPTSRPTSAHVPTREPMKYCAIAVQLECRLLNGGSCNAIQPKGCNETLIYANIANTGDDSVTVTDATMTINGQAFLVENLSRTALPSGEETGLKPRIEVNVCNAATLDARVFVRADHPNGGSCVAEDRIVVAAQTDTPTLQASTPTPTPPDSQPRVSCLIEVAFRCRLSDLRDCEEIEERNINCGENKSGTQ